MPRCENCDELFEHEHEMDKESVDQLEVDDSQDPPRIRVGTGQRDVWRCKGCGKVLGVK